MSKLKEDLQYLNVHLSRDIQLLDDDIVDYDMQLSAIRLKALEIIDACDAEQRDQIDRLRNARKLG